MTVSGNKVLLATTFAFLSISASSLPLYAAGIADGKAAGTASGVTAMGAYGDKNAIKNNVSSPMTGGGVLMKTLDNSQSFDATMSAPSSGQFLEILMQPGGTGDLVLVKVGQDTDANGTLDNSFDIGVPVSGICANGFISCTPGTWANCKPYTWKSVEGKLVREIASITSLGGCYCINSSCGSQLVWSNSAIVLQGLGGAMVAALSNENATTMVTDVQSDAVSIRYHGRVISDTANDSSPVAAGIPSAPQAQAYFSSPASLTGDKDDISLTQGSNPDSLYYKMSNSAAFAGASELKRCSITVDGSINSVTNASYYDSGTMFFYTEHFIDMRIWRSPDQQTYKLQLLDYYETLHQGILGNPAHEPMEADGWHTIHEFTLPLDSSRVQSKLSNAIFSIKLVSGAGCVAGSVFTIDGMSQGFNTRVNVGGYCSADGVQHPLLEWSYLFEFKSDSYTEQTSDQCAALVAADPTCEIKSEIEDSFVVSVRNGHSTGLHSEPSRKTFTGAVGTMDFYRDWWRKDREYICSPDSVWDLSGVNQRYNSINSTATNNDNTLTFTDKRMEGGVLTDVASSITLPEGDTYSECMKSCKVKRPRLDSQVSLTGVPAQNRTDPETFDIYYLSCVDEVTCPSSPGDILVTDCSCLNEFGQASSVLQMMRMGGGDSICSDGEAKQL